MYLVPLDHVGSAGVKFNVGILRRLKDVGVSSKGPCSVGVG